MIKKTNRIILSAEELKLWVKVGGRYEICNKFINER